MEHFADAIPFGRQGKRAQVDAAQLAGNGVQHLAAGEGREVQLPWAARSVGYRSDRHPGDVGKTVGLGQAAGGLPGQCRLAQARHPVQADHPVTVVVVQIVQQLGQHLVHAKEVGSGSAAAGGGRATECARVQLPGGNPGPLPQSACSKAHRAWARAT